MGIDLKENLRYLSFRKLYFKEGFMGNDVCAKCASCGRVEKNGKWVDPKEINPKILRAIGTVICLDCRPKANKLPKANEFNGRGIA